MSMQVDPIIQFVTARLDELGQVARDAVGTAVFQRQTGQWEAQEVDHSIGSSLIVFAVAEDGARTQAADLTAAWEGPQRAAHIARNDPARVLAQIEATRKIIANARTTLDGSWQLGEEAREATAFLAVRTLQHLAELDADHPDYDPAWQL